MKKIFFKNKKAFSMIEVMLASFLVTAGLIVIVSLLSVDIRQSTKNKNNLIAGFLAQEGVELVRNIRDTNWVNGQDSFLNILSRDDCRVDANNFSRLYCGYSSFSLYYDDTVYSHSGSSSQKTRFSRKIIVEDKASGDQKIITSVVVWGDNFPSGGIDEENCNIAEKCVFSKISLTKWKEE